jgi:hypothetical protein
MMPADELPSTSNLASGTEGDAANEKQSVLGK